MEISHNGWVLLVTEAQASHVLCLPSVNLELTIQVPDMTYPPEVKVGEKNSVADISDAFEPGTGRQFFRVALLSGKMLEFEVEPGHWGPAGSSFNVSMALRRWGVHRPAVCAPIGVGPGGTSIRLTFERDGLSPALFESHGGTPRTLTVRDSTGNSTLFCRKVPYSMPPAVVDWVGHGRHELVLATSVKPIDVPLVSRVYFQQAQATRVFIPHKELIRDMALRHELEALIRQSHLVQVNASEAALILGEEVTLSNAVESVTRLRSMMEGGLAIITLGEGGAVLSDGKNGYHQPIFSVTVQDQSGGGDSHLSAFVYCHFIRALGIEVSLTVAAWVASRVIAQVGPWVGLPTLGDLDEQIRRLS